MPAGSTALADLGGRRIGPHLPLGRGLLMAAERAADIGATAAQIFSDNPVAWRRRAEPPPDLEAFRDRLAELDIGPLAIHAPYLINLAGSDEIFWERSIATLADELRVGARYGARFVAVHVGSHRGHGREQGVRRLGEGLRRVLDETSGGDGPILVLENSAGSGDGIGSSVEDLVDILEAAARAGADGDRLGLCLDTAHLWGAGVDLADPDALDSVLRRLDGEAGPQRLAMVHLNDARTLRGSRLDRHEHIGAGTIGPGLRHVLNHPRLAGVPTYLETPGMDTGYDAVNMDRVRLLMAGEALPDLPPEAFESRSSRSSSGPPAPDPTPGA
jgi:deoxyribonuclease-4